MDPDSPRLARSVLLIAACSVSGLQGQAPAPAVADSDLDGLDDLADTCPRLRYRPGFAVGQCRPMDLDPTNDADPECKARERVARLMLQNGRFTTRMTFAVVRQGRLHVADAFEYVGQGRFVRDPAGVYRLYRIGSTSKAIVAVTAKILEEQRAVSFGDYVDATNAGRLLTNGQRTLGDLLGHRGCFKLDSGALHLFCYRGDLMSFWRDPDDLVSPRYDSPRYGNLGGGFEYSAFNYSLAGAYLANQTGRTLATLLQTLVFDPAGMCTATVDGARAAGSPIGAGYGVSQAAVMHVGPTINQVAPTDPRCVDNYYSSNALPNQGYTWLPYRLDEASAEARDPAGGVVASVVDLGHFAAALLRSYRAAGGLVSPAGIRDLWAGRSDLGCGTSCAYERYYGLGFFTDSLPGVPVNQVGHGGSRAGYASAFVLRPERHVAVCILANADVSTVAMSDVAKAILDDFR